MGRQSCYISKCHRCACSGVYCGVQIIDLYCFVLFFVFCFVLSYHSSVCVSVTCWISVCTCRFQGYREKYTGWSGELFMGSGEDYFCVYQIIIISLLTRHNKQKKTKRRSPLINPCLDRSVYVLIMTSELITQNIMGPGKLLRGQVKVIDVDNMHGDVHICRVMNKISLVIYHKHTDAFDRDWFAFFVKETQ